MIPYGVQNGGGLRLSGWCRSDRIELMTLHSAYAWAGTHQFVFADTTLHDARTDCRINNLSSIFIAVENEDSMDNVRAFAIFRRNVVSINFRDKWHAFQTQPQFGSASLGRPFKSKN